MTQRVATIQNNITANFVNRTHELETLWRAIEQQDQERIVLVVGQSGIGKTALLLELRVQCAARGVASVYVDLAKFEYARNPNYLGIVLDIWDQLGLGAFDELSRLILQTRAYGGTALPNAALAMALPAVEPANANDHDSDHALLPNLEEEQQLLDQPTGGDTIIGTVGNVGPYALVAIGKDIVQNLFIQSVDTPEIRQLLRNRISALFQARLAALAQAGTVVLLVDGWEAVVTKENWLKELGAWLYDEVVQPISMGQLPGVCAILASNGVWGEGDLFRRSQRLDLHALSEDAAQSYFSEQRRLELPPDIVAALAEISGGVPLAMHFIAAGVKAQGGIDNPMDRQIEQVNAQNIIRQAVEAYLGGLPNQKALMMRRAAIPHRVNASLLMRLFGSDTNWDEVIQSPFVSQSDDGTHYTYHAEVRRYLLSWWRNKQSSAEFISTNQSLLDYYQELFTQAQQAKQATHYVERELIFHQLMIGETDGIVELLTRFENACERFALGEAQGLVDPLAELADLRILTERGRRWLHFFVARLDLIYRRGDWGEDALQELTEQVEDRALTALARWNLGRLRLAHHRWTEGIKLCRASLTMLTRQEQHAYAARVLFDLGNAYYDLANQSGGFADEETTYYGRRNAWLHQLQHLPFLLYERLVHRVDFLPNWYFSTNYQNWIVAYLLTEAANWHRQAESRLATIGDAAACLQARLALAEIDHLLGHWRRARQRYAELQGQIVHTEGRHSYRMAQMKLRRGRAQLMEGDLSNAQLDLQEAFEAFQHFDDQRNVATATAFLGQTLAKLGQPNEAVTAYATSIVAATDELQQTASVWALEDLTVYHRLSSAANAEATVVLANVKRHRYITRFPDTLLRWFRHLALLGSLPVTYLLLFFVAFALAILLAGVEAGITSILRDGWVSDLNIVISGVVGVAAILLFILCALWLYRFVYSTFGLIFVQLLGRRLLTIEKNQPDQIVTDTTGLTYIDGSAGAQQTWLWSEFTLLGFVERRQRRRPIALISNIMLKAANRPTLVLEGVTAGYEHLKEDIVRHLNEVSLPIKPVYLNFVLLAGRWLLAITFAILLYLILDGGLTDVSIGSAPTAPTPGISGGVGEASDLKNASQIATQLAPILVPFVPLLLFVMPAITLWRLIYHSRSVRRKFGNEVKLLPLWLVWLAAIFCSLIAAGGLAIVYRL